ncbi:MAG: DUF3800 domain-containing protein [Candidatus Andersenbacteria bacterium]
MNTQGTLFVFIDESGNFDFSELGTKYFVMGSMSTMQPIASARPLLQLRYWLLSRGIDVPFFHAAPDAQLVRDQVFSTINSTHGIRCCVAHAQKRLLPTNLRDPVSMYARFGRALLTRTLQIWSTTPLKRIVVIFDKTLIRKEQRALLKAIKPVLKTTGKPFHVFFHSTMADLNGQIADYVSWARYVSLSRGEERPMRALGNVPIDALEVS